MAEFAIIVKGGCVANVFALNGNSDTSYILIDEDCLYEKGTTASELVTAENIDEFTFVVDGAATVEQLIENL